MPLDDRDYMRRSPVREYRRAKQFINFNIDPIWAIIFINFLMFLVTVIWGRAILQINGDIYPIYQTHFYLGLIPAIAGDRPWTFLTNIFLHATFWHILFNMLGLYFLGRMLKSFIGNKFFLLLYLVGGVLANVVYFGFNTSSTIPSIGASGAVYGIAGALVVIVPNIRVALWGIIPMPLWVFVIVFLLLLSLPPFVGSDVAWQAHIGGLAVGLIAGYFFRRRLQRYYIIP